MTGGAQKKNGLTRMGKPFFLELVIGLEPMTCALRMRCSTN
jgi:hypothetical protein